MSTKSIQDFKETILQFYRQNGRSFAWRHEADPYKIVISEVMLQQTQTHRVAPKYATFIAAFPTVQDLARAHLRDVLLHWQGLGYNRRGKFLHELAQEISEKYNGTIPQTPEELVQLPGIGPATAASICAFAYNKPTLFIETNIRAVYIHFFFQGSKTITDKQLMPYIQKTLDAENPREWYYALMDYGVMLKKTMPNPSRKSAHHVKQSTFEGSDRQIRGMIIKLLTSFACLSIEQLQGCIDREPTRVARILQQLIDEKLLQEKQGIVRITVNT